MTLVTAFYNLSEIEKRPYDKTKKNYLKWSEEILKLNINIVFFVQNNEIYSYIWNKRKEYKLISKTLIINKKFSSLQWFNCIEDLKIYKLNNKIKNSSIRDSVNYMVLIWNKINFVEEIIKLNPFDSDYFGWIDFGLCREKRIFENMDLNKIIGISDKIKILEIKWILDEEIKDYYEYTRYLRYRVAGGLWIGNKKNNIELIKLFKKYLYEFLSKEIVTTQEPIFDIIYKKHNNLFNPYYGHYDEILKNFNKITILSETIVNNIKHCRLNKNYLHAYKICNKVLNDMKHNLSPVQKFVIYDELIISSYYINKEESNKIVQEWLNDLDNIIKCKESDELNSLVNLIKLKYNRLKTNFKYFEDGDKFIEILDRLLNNN